MVLLDTRYSPSHISVTINSNLLVCQKDPIVFWVSLINLSYIRHINIDDVGMCLYSLISECVFTHIDDVWISSIFTHFQSVYPHILLICLGYSSLSSFPNPWNSCYSSRFGMPAWTVSWGKGYLLSILQAFIKTRGFIKSLVLKAELPNFVPP